MRGAERFTSLLEPLNLSHRLVNNLADITPEMLQAPIDWTETDRLLAEQRRQSLQFLTSHLNV